MSAFLDRFRDLYDGQSQPQQPRPHMNFDLDKCNPQVKAMLERFYETVKVKTGVR